MQSILRATAMLSASSLVSIAVGLFSAKAWATLIGAEGIGYIGLLQSIVGLALMVAGLGIGPGLVRAGAAAIARDDWADVAALRRAGWLLFAVPGSLMALLLVLFRNPISRLALNSPDKGGAVALMGVAVLLSLANSVQTSLLNAHHRVSALAKIGVINSVLGALTGILIVWKFGERAVPVVIIMTASFGLLVSRFFLRREVPAGNHEPSRAAILARLREMVRFGVPYTASMIVGTGVQLALPFLVVRQLGKAEVGYYRAAIAISVTYLGFVTTAMAQDYFPRLSAAADDPQRLTALANQQLRLVLLIVTPMILGVMALAPYLVPLAYARSFAPTADLLEWQLIGDLFKATSWTMAFVILATLGSSNLLFVESIGGLSIVVFSWTGLRWFGLNGMGVSFMLSYLVYTAVVWFLLRRKIGFSLTPSNTRALIAALCAAAFIRALPYVGLEQARTPIALGLAVAGGFWSLWTIVHELGGVPLLSWQRSSG